MNVPGSSPFPPARLATLAALLLTLHATGCTRDESGALRPESLERVP